MSRCTALAAAALLVAACATSPTGRSQLRLFPEEQMAQMGVAAWDEMRQTMQVSSDERAQRTARCIADAITAVVTGPEAGTRWEVTVFDDDSPNAFALPGGKIGVHTGLFRVAANQHQLATVMGHEVAHVLAQHGNERVSTAYATQSGLALVQAIGNPTSPMGQQLMGALGVGAQVGVLLPFSRTQESEADQMGLDLMARAGFDPRESTALWRNMSAAGGGAPPEFLSTHPAHGTRIQRLEARIPEALRLMEAARAAGRRPSCG